MPQVLVKWRSGGSACDQLTSLHAPMP